IAFFACRARFIPRNAPMTYRRRLALAFFFGLTVACGRVSAADQQPRYAQRWFYAAFNLQVDKNADDLIALIERAGKSGYNGLVLADYKLNILERVPKHYFKNVERVQKAAKAAGLEIIPTVCPIGYSAGLLAHDPNLAEGVPVKDAPFVVRQGQAIMARDSTGQLTNGNLELLRKPNLFACFSFQDEPGKSSFADSKVVHGGKLSCRMQDFKNHPAGNCRLAQRVKVRPWACYRLSAWVKTENLAPAGDFRLAALGGRKNNRTLSYFDDAVKPTQDWKQVQVVFNSLDETDIVVYAGIWGGRSGKLWLDDLDLEELALVNILRRDGCPLTVTSEDGKTVYEEGK